MAGIYNKDGSLRVQISGVSQVIPDFKTPAEFLGAYEDFNQVNWSSGDFVAIKRSAIQQIVSGFFLELSTKVGFKTN